MKAEIIAVGSELLGTSRLDTNSLYLTEQLDQLGIDVVFKCVVGDDRAALEEEVRRSVSRAQIVLLTGGLGPTEDDVTRDAVAAALGRPLRYHAEIHEKNAARFQALGRKIAENNQRQAFIVEGGEILPNDRGTAPGQWIESGGVSLVLLPGPPHEMKAMYERQCAPRLLRKAPQRVIRSLTLRVAGMGESDLDALIAPVYTQYTNPVTTVLAAAGDITVIFRATCETGAQAEALLGEVGGPVETLLGDRIYSRNGDPLEVVVGELLRQHRATLAVAESCTGGMLAERITAVPGASDYFAGGVIAYTAAMKRELLDIPEAALSQYGAVSAETAQAMAEGARRRTGATHALSVTGIAGPGTGGESAPVGTLYIGFAGAAGAETLHRRVLGDRNRIRQFAVTLALDLLRRRLAGPA